MKAIQYISPNSIRVNEVEEPVAATGEIVIDVAFSGICGTDMTIRAGQHPRARGPLTLGHEISGRIAEIGSNVSSPLAVGDLVTFNPLISCGCCRACREGNRHVCSNLKLYGIDSPGGMARYVAVSASSVLALPKGVAPEKGALAEPLAVGFHAVSEGRPKPSDRVLVVGAGPIGLVTALALRHSGVPDVLISDVSEFRLQLAAKLGLRTIIAEKDAINEHVQSWTDGEGVDQIYEASGHESAIPGLLELARPRGLVMFVSVHKAARPMDLRLINFKELVITGCRCYRDSDFANAVAALPDIAVESLVTHRLPLEEGPTGFSEMSHTDRSCKVLFEIS